MGSGGANLISLAVSLLCPVALGAGEQAVGPLSPREEADSFRFADTNLVAELVASEPTVISPVAMAWDEDRRLFVVEMNDYPLGSGSGQIRLLQDPDAEGQFQRVTVFADRLPFPTSVLPWNGGVLVTAAPNIWFLKDTDADGRADERRVLFTGFGEGNQQLRVNGLFWGLDNWVYGANGRSDGEVRKPGDPPAQAVSLRGHDFRFRPETGEFQALAGRSQFGTTRDEWGNRFLSWNTIPIRHVVIEERYLSRNPALALTDSVEDLLPTEDTQQVFPLTPPPWVFNEESASHFNALAGLSLFRGDALGRDLSGAEYRGNAFMGESLRNLVHRRVLVPDGATFKANRGESGTEFLASSDPWFHPVNFVTGPDGALYILDFYRRFVEHPHYVHDPSVIEKVPWRQGADHGRIWRVRRRDKEPVSSAGPRLSAASTQALVKLLHVDNAWLRDTSHRLLVQRQDRSALPALEQAARDEVLPLAQIHALHILAELQALTTGVLVSGLESRNAAVRQNAAELAESRVNREAPLQKALSALATDSEAQVRLRVALALGAWNPEGAALAEKISAFSRLLSPEPDVWISRAVLSGLGSHGWALFKSVLPENRPVTARTREAAYLVQQLSRLIGAAGTPQDVSQALSWVVKSQPLEFGPGRLVFLAGFMDGLEQRPGPRQDWNERARHLLDGREVDLQPLFKAAREVLVSPTTPEHIQLAAIRVLSAAQTSTAGDALLNLLLPDQPAAVQNAAARGLMKLNDAELAAQLFTNWSRYPRPARQAVLSAAPSSRALAEALLSELEQRRISLLEVNASTSQALQKSAFLELRPRAQALFANSAAADRHEVLRKFGPALKLEGDRRRGAEVFAKSCLICHEVRGVGGHVGPDLSAVGTRPKESLLVDILDPSRTVSADFISYTLETTDGRSFTGLIANETAAHVTIRRAQQPDETVSRLLVKDLRADGKSLMPDGLEQGWPLESFADLLAFLKSPDPSLLPKN